MRPPLQPEYYLVDSRDLGFHPAVEGRGRDSTQLGGEPEHRDKRCVRTVLASMQQKEAVCVCVCVCVCGGDRELGKIVQRKRK